MNKSKFFSRLIIVFAVMGASMAWPAYAALMVSKSQDLSFGSFVPTSSSGTVSIAPAFAGNRSGSGVVLLFQGVGAAGKSAVFNVSGGSAGYTCDITLSSATLAGAGTSMLASLASTPSGTILLDGAGGGTIYVGGTLSVGAAQAAGSYSDTITMTVNNCRL